MHIFMQKGALTPVALPSGCMNGLFRSYQVEVQCTERPLHTGRTCNDKPELREEGAERRLAADQVG